MAAPRGRSKVQIRPARRHGPDISIDEIWQKLSHNIVEIQNHNAMKLSYEENHRYAYNMVLYKQGAKLHNGTKDLIVKHLNKLTERVLFPTFPNGREDDLTQRASAGETLLKALRKVWDDHTSGLSKISDVLKYMDKVNEKSAQVPKIWDAGVMLFTEHILRTDIRTPIISAILVQLQTEREGYVINRSAVRGCVDVLSQLDDNEGDNVYKVSVEPEVLRESGVFYNAEGVRLLETCDASTFLARVEGRFEQEESRVNHYLHSSTHPLLRRILEDALLRPHLSAILSKPNSGLEAMIDLHKVDDLRRLYRLFAMVNEGIPTLKRALRESILRRGKDTNLASTSSSGELEGQPADEMDASAQAKRKGKARAPNIGSQTLSYALKWVQDVLDLKDRFNTFLDVAFQKDREIESSMTEAFETFINLNQKAPEFISLFIDDNLKKGLKGKSEEEVDIILDKTIVVFRYITDKDIFERYYKNHLAKRLLLGRSISDDAERSMLAKLKVECGTHYTQKLEGMFHDMKLSADTMQAYRAHLAKTTAPELDIAVTVMTSTFWPMSHAAAPCNFPDQLIRSSKSFEQFYLSRHSGRRLTWQPSLGNADVRVRFNSRAHDLNVSTFALVILLLFEDATAGDSLTYEYIRDMTAISEAELQRNLQSLACAKYKILKKHPAGREVNPGDSFSFNADFSAPLQKIKISTVSNRVESMEERKETQDRIDEDRKYQIEACIVRIMKDRKHMTHQALVSSVVQQLGNRFHPDPNTIKQRIEGLIEREYLERCEDKKSYNYLA
ncbi:Cullin-domain-containing protein [Wolfiporia cocos MD-104 SS10]|uniref:Cullin-domain-containing protein n=1 Tax=Wolfiporia cocos (strain MD-104) TaxID=742152 RepID=A0A2H3JWE0_WOLCO|nr:Cullin-domain-containing protein [Wolfiporia cocos MD-104 SS10]